MALLEADFHSQLHLVSLANTSFYVGHLHFNWCMNSERQQVKLFETILSEKRNNCTVLDVGMNDGFYTQMAASFGCRVHSFEIQSLCINISRYALVQNHFEHLVTIYPNPVSETSGTEIQILFTATPTCDGGFTFSGPAESRSSRTHLHQALVSPHNFTSVALSTFLPIQNAYIDMMKIDVECHELEVLTGLLPLLRERRIGIIVIELSPMKFYSDPVGLINIYREIVNLGYGLTTMNCAVKRGDDDTFTASTFNMFEQYVHWKTYWRCPDLRIQLV